MNSLWSQFKTLIFVGWIVAFVRLGLDAAVPDASMYVGVYYGMPVVLLVFAFLGTFREVSWGRLALGMVLTGILVWGPPNLIAYTAAQFAEWDHGRFGAGRGPEIADTLMGKVAAGALTALMTSVAGSVWMVLWSTLLIWLPRKFGTGSADEIEAESAEDEPEEVDEESV